jgi:hypothetical protein
VRDTQDVGVQGKVLGACYTAPVPTASTVSRCGYETYVGQIASRSRADEQRSEPSRYSALHWNIQERKKVFSCFALVRSVVCHGLSRQKAACQSKL